MYNEQYILDHIKTYGNTNLISNSGLQSGSQIFAIGDSHTIYFYNSLKIKEHWLCKNDLPLTIYKFLNNDLDIYNIGNILENGHELYNIKENDYVMFFFGYNDIQRNIYLHHKNDWKNEIDNLINSYIDKIIFIKEKFKIIPIIPCIYPNPRHEAVGMDYRGTDFERLSYTIYTNKKLKDICDKTSLKFLNIFDIISDNNGFIKIEYTTDCIHLDYNNKYLRNIVEGEIYKLCN